MDKLDLSPEARRCLWQCYSLLLKLAEEADTNDIIDPELGESQELSAATESNELIGLGDDAVEVGPEQIQAEG